MGGQVSGAEVDDADRYSADTVKLQLTLWQQCF
jgi:hypothetical protein